MYWFSESPLKIPCRSRTLEPLGDFLGTSPRCRVPAGYRDNKETVKSNKEKQKKHNKIVMLAKSKLNSIETLMPQALIDLDIRHEEFKTIVNEKEKYEHMKESIRKADESSENSRDIRKNNGNA